MNTTSLAASLTVAEVDPEEPRIGVLAAKATYRFDARGRTALDTDEPFPIFSGDQETDLGYLPRDDFPRSDPVFEVIVLGAAYTPGEKPLEQQTVALTVGTVRRELRVFGDRVWEGMDEPPDARRISRPVPFTRMPLTWERAFGGSCELLIDVDSPVTVTNPTNRSGMGFDPAPAAQQLAQTLVCPAGYPAYDKTRRLPNVENPSEMIQRWEDAPKPVCWATVPLDSGLHAQRSVDVADDGETVFPITVQERLWHRAHPDWVIDVPAAGAGVCLEGLTPEGTISFALPRLRVLADYVVGDRSGTREPAPQMLVLLPEEKRFYVLYRLLFNCAFEPGVERSMRLRTEEGWLQPAAREA